MSEDLKHTIYTSTECLSEKMLFDYIDNKLSQKERHFVEKHLLDCELCSDALEGLELVKDRNKISLIKEAIGKRVEEAGEKEAIVVSFNYKMVFSVAATIALLVVGVFFFNTINDKAVSTNGLAELKKEESSDSAPPPPPADPMDEVNNIVTKTPGGTGVASGKALQAPPTVVADQEVAFAEEQNKPDVGYYKNSKGDGDVAGVKNEQAPVQSANGTIVLTDEITTADDRKDINLETVSIPKAVVTEREKDGKLDQSKKTGEVSTGASGGAYAWETPKNPERDKNQENNTNKTPGDKAGEQAELAKKADAGGKYRAESAEKGKDKLASGKKENRAKEDATVGGTVAYEPQSVAQDNDELKVETKTTVTNATNSTTNNNIPFESTISADSTSVEPVYTVVEEMPQYPGGDAALIKAATKQLTYPAKEDASNSFGTIIIEFIVDSSGKATHPKLIKPKSAALEKQVIDFVNKMPKWKPGKQNNKNVAVKLVLPIKINVK